MNPIPSDRKPLSHFAPDFNAMRVHCHLVMSYGRHPIADQNNKLEVGIWDGCLCLSLVEDTLKAEFQGQPSIEQIFFSRYSLESGNSFKLNAYDESEPRYAVRIVLKEV